MEKSSAPAARSAGQSLLFAACFASLVATSFAFIIRIMAMDQWQIAFQLTETQKGEIFGAGLYPFGISIVLFSLIIDRIGYGRSMIFAFVCHVASTVMLVTADGYGMLYAGSVLNGLAAGTVEAVINPAVASRYPNQKTRMLTILHAGWPGGIMLGGLIVKLLGVCGFTSWHAMVLVILLPVLLYGVLLLKARFPVSERVVAGVPYRDMLAEAGAIGWLIVIYMIVMEINRLLGGKLVLDTTFIDLPSWPALIVIALTTGAYLAYSRSAGRPMYVFLLLVMILLAITELGTDTWIKELMAPAMGKLDAVWILIYTASLMMVLRFCIGPIERRLRPLGVLLVSSLLAAAGLYFLPIAEGGMIVVMATIYGAGQCFFWPVTLGLVSEQFPRGGALTLNAIAGVGMLGVGILGSQLLGFWQDTNIDRALADTPAAYTQLMSNEEHQSIFGSYQALDGKRVAKLTDSLAIDAYRAEHGTEALADDEAYHTLLRSAVGHQEGDDSAEPAVLEADLRARGFFLDDPALESATALSGTLENAVGEAKRGAMQRVSSLPLTMALCYLVLLLYFKKRGGYKPVEL